MYGMIHLIIRSCIVSFGYKLLIEKTDNDFYVFKAWEGVGVVASARKLIGSTDPLQAEPGTIRGDLAVQTGRLDYVYLFQCLYFLDSIHSDNETYGQECYTW